MPLQEARCHLCHRKIERDEGRFTCYSCMSVVCEQCGTRRYMVRGMNETHIVCPTDGSLDMKWDGPPGCHHDFVHCAYCAGWGKLHDYKTNTEKKCDVCGGTGWNKFKAAGICTTCEGSGSLGGERVLVGRPVDLTNRPKCPMCHGKGYTEIV
jgi:hypothetical protein